MVSLRCKAAYRQRKTCIGDQKVAITSWSGAMYSVNDSGPRMDPCGTPMLTLCVGPWK